MKNLTRFATRLSTLAIAGWLGTALITPAHATLTPPGVCPAAGVATDCNLLITFAANGSISTQNGPQTTYDGIEDALIGVVNNSGHTLTSFNISSPGVPLFGFDGDGIDGFVPVSPVPGNPDTTGYGGALAFFTNISLGLDSGKVNFFGGLLDGSTTYFSLEEPINVNAPPHIGTPEPPALPMLGLGLIGMGWLAWRRKAA